MSADRFRRVSAGRGASWLGRGSNLVGQGGAPMLRVAVWLLVISLLQMIPVVGLPLLVLVTPIVTAGVLTAFRSVSAGRAASGEMVFAAFGDASARRRLLLLGAWLLFGSILSAAILFGALSAQMDLQELLALMSDPEVVENEPQRIFALFEGVNPFWGLAGAAAVFAVTLTGLHFAVPLTWFWSWPPLTALLWSLRAVAANWLAFLAFGAVLIGLVIAAGIAFGLVSTVLTLALGSAGAFLAQLVYVGLTLFVQLLLAAAQWVSFVDVFPAGETGGAPGDDASGPE